MKRCRNIRAHAIPWPYWLSAGLLLFAGCPLASAAEVDVSKLPPQARDIIYFERDIKPILEKSCLRCHGPEKPKSKYRLDNRADALKGGEKGVDILPGNSAKSPLIHYVAYLVEDTEMPPVSKGDQLTTNQVSLLRAWIDQGLIWDDSTSSLPPDSITLVGGGTAVKGDTHKFREHSWIKDGAYGGVEQFDFYDQPDPHTVIKLSGHALPNDYQVGVFADRSEVGFIHSGWQQFRKYYDDTGGYRPAPTTLSALSLNRELYLHNGKAWMDFGLTLPNWPRMVVGYEYDYRHGDEAITSWGAGGVGANLRSIAPASKGIQEDVHVIKFDLDHEIQGVTIEDRFRAEFYRLNTQTTNLAARGAVGNNTTEGNRYFQGANTLRLEKQFYPWLLCSGGYLYSRLNADSTFADTVTASGLAFLSRVPQITLEKESHVFNLNALAGPFDGLTATAGAQSEWTRQHAFGSGNLNSIAYTFSSPGTLAVNPATLMSDYDQNSVSETLALRYTKIPFTVLFAEGRFQQQRIGQSESDLQASGNFLENPLDTILSSDMRAGFNTSPWRGISFSAHYRRHEENSHYDTNLPPQPAGGYPGFIGSRDVVTDEVEAKLVWHLSSRLHTTFTYQYVTSDYWTDTRATVPANISPGGNLLAGQYQSQVYSFGTTVMPCSRLTLSGTFAYQPTVMTTATDNSAAFAPYRGNIYSVIANGSYVLTKNTDLLASYAFSKADFGQNNFAAGLPIGIVYQQHGVQAGLTHRFNRDLSAGLQYRFNYYEEPSSGSANNYRAHALLASMTFKFR